MSLILQTADVHLDSPLAGLPAYEGVPAAELRLATRRAFSNIVDLAIGEGADLVLIAGDLYDGDLRDANTGLFLCAELTRLRRAAIEVVIAYGNHDAESVVTRRLPLPEGVRTLSTRRAETVLFQKLGIAVHGQSFGRRDITRDLAAGYPDPREGVLNIGVLHTAVTGREGHAPYAPCSVDTLATRGYAYWALGHVHKFEVLSEDPWIVFPGCPQGRGLRECDEKGVVLIETEGEEVLGVERRFVDVVRWADLGVDVAGVVDREEALSRVREALAEGVDAADGRTLACRVKLIGRTSVHRSLGARPQQLVDEIRAIALDAGGGQLWIEGVRCATEPDAATTDLTSRRDPIARLLLDSRALAADPEDLVEQAPSVRDLTRMLPPGVLNGEHGGPEDPAWLAERVAGAEGLLVGRLGAGLDAT
jgi:DNA repair exonuclease SbcCD nuclease subunit